MISLGHFIPKQRDLHSTIISVGFTKKNTEIKKYVQSPLDWLAVGAEAWEWGTKVFTSSFTKAVRGGLCGPVEVDCVLKPG